MFVAFPRSSHWWLPSRLSWTLRCCPRDPFGLAEASTPCRVKTVKMIHLLLFSALGMGGLTVACAKEPEKVAPHRVCIGVNKCIGSMWPLSEVENAYGTRGVEVEEGIKEVCIRRAGVYLRLQYGLRSTGGLKGQRPWMLLPTVPLKTVRRFRLKARPSS